MTRLPIRPGWRRRAQAFAVAAAPALAMLALAPVAHGTAMDPFLPMCGDGPFLASPDLAVPPAKKREQRQASLCAHATCPRELRLGRGQRPG